MPLDRSSTYVYTDAPTLISCDEVSQIMVAVAQLVRAPGCGPGGRWFKSSQLYHIMGQKLAHYVPKASDVGTLLVHNRTYNYKKLRKIRSTT